MAIQRDIKIEKYYDFAPQLVWEALTSRELLAEWLMENDFEPRVGHKFQFRTKPQPGFDGIIRGKVLGVLAPKQLSYTWQSGDDIATVVTFDLRAQGSGTNLTLTHAGFRGLSAFFTSYILQMGWKHNLLQKQLPKCLARLQLSC